MLDSKRRRSSGRLRWRQDQIETNSFPENEFINWSFREAFHALTTPTSNDYSIIFDDSSSVHKNSSVLIIHERAMYSVWIEIYVYQWHKPYSRSRHTFIPFIAFNLNGNTSEIHSPQSSLLTWFRTQRIGRERDETRINWIVSMCRSVRMSVWWQQRSASCVCSDVRVYACARHIKWFLIVCCWV